MPRLTRCLAVAASTAALTFAVQPLATADPPAPGDPCAKQETKLAQAQEAYAHVTAVFARQQQHVSAARSALAHAQSHAQQVHAQQALTRAQAKKDAAKATKRAQLQRLAKDQQRLDECQAAQSS